MEMEMEVFLNQLRSYGVGRYRRYPRSWRSREMEEEDEWIT